eukprot:SAG25_NODE_4823_length_745_cov_1.130031_1_plen_95_part_10
MYHSVPWRYFKQGEWLDLDALPILSVPMMLLLPARRATTPLLAPKRTVAASHHLAVGDDDDCWLLCRSTTEWQCGGCLQLVVLADIWPVISLAFR